MEIRVFSPVSGDIKNIDLYTEVQNGHDTSQTTKRDFLN